MDRAVDDPIRAAIRTGASTLGSNNAARLAHQLFEQTNHALHALNVVQDSVVVVDPHGHITSLNQAAEQLLGWTTPEVVNRSVRTTLYAGSKSSFDAAWREVRHEGEWRGTIAQSTKSGVERLVESRWSAMYDIHSSKLSAVVMVGTEDSNVNVTAADLAHEIRNPLAGIKGIAEAFLQRGQLTPQEREWMQAVRDEVMKIDARVREFLDLSQTREPNVTECLLSDVISRVVLLVRRQLQSINDRQITVRFIDTTTEPLVMPVDSARIGDAVLNLVLNAIESIAENGRVSVYLRRRKSTNGDGEALIEVTDTGCGIPPEIRDRMFEPLFTTKLEGMGLGLAAVRRTAAAYHGRITFKTRIGRGSTFVLALPLRSQLNLAENPKSRLSLL